MRNVFFVILATFAFGLLCVIGTLDAQARELRDELEMLTVHNATCYQDDQDLSVTIEGDKHAAMMWIGKHGCALHPSGR